MLFRSELTRDERLVKRFPEVHGETIRAQWTFDDPEKQLDDGAQVDPRDQVQEEKHHE